MFFKEENLYHPLYVKKYNSKKNNSWKLLFFIEKDGKFYVEKSLCSDMKVSLKDQFYPFSPNVIYECKRNNRLARETDEPVNFTFKYIRIRDNEIEEIEEDIIESMKIL